MAMAFGVLPRSALVFGAALALSSTAIVLPSLAERKRLGSAAGRTSFAILLFQDLAVAPLLFMVTLLAARHGGGSGLSALYALGTAMVALVALVIAGRLVLRPLFQLVAQTGSSELFVAACLLVVIGMGAITAASGQSMSLGAFIAGILLAETEYRRQVEMTVQPFQGLLLGLFFVSVGARLDFAQILARPGLLLGLVVGILIVKMVVIVPLARLAGLSRVVANQTAFILAPAGEFALVLIGTAIAVKIVPATTGANAMIAATISMFAIPLLVRASERFVPRGEDNADLSALMPQGEDETPRVIIVGYGRVGELVGQMLTRHKIPFLALDDDAGLVTRERATRRADLLWRCHAHRIAAAVRHRPGARARRDHGQARGGRGGDRCGARGTRPTSPSSPAPAMPAMPPSSTASTSPTPCRRPSKRACSSPKPRWSASACRWGSSSPRSTKSATNSARCCKPPPRRAARAWPSAPRRGRRKTPEIRGRGE